MISYQYYLMVGAILFVLGLIGFMVRRNLIIMFLSTELMITGVLVNLVAFNQHWIRQTGAGLDGQIFAIFLLAVAAAEAALALILVMVMQRKTNTLNVGDYADLKG